MATRSRSKQQASASALVNLTPQEVRQLPKPHPGFEPFGEPLAALFEQFPDDLGTNGVDLDELRTELAAFSDVEAKAAEALAQLALLEKTRLYHASKAWSIMLVIYMRARVAARTNPEIARAIASFEAFMKQGPRKKKATTPPASTPPAGSSTT